MEQLPLNALRAFAAVCEQGGVRAAARALGVAHSSVSRHLRELEVWLGAPLIEPSGGHRGLHLTAQGEALGTAVRAGLADITAAVATMRESHSTFAVTLSTSPSVAARWLLPRLPALAVAHPRVELSVLIDQRVEDPGRTRADLLLRMGTGPWAGARAEPLMNDALYPVMSASAWRDAGQPHDPAQLADLSLLHDRDPQAAWSRWRDVFGPPRLDLARGPRFASSDLLLRAAMQGQGVALARHRLVADDLTTGLLVRPFGDRHVPLETSYWLVRSDIARPPRHAVVTVMRWLQAQVDRSGA